MTTAAPHRPIDSDVQSVIAPATRDAVLRHARSLGYGSAAPRVLDPTLPLADDIPAVAAMNTAGARAGVDHLIALGHRRIGIITGSLQWTESIDRLAGYHAALAAASLVTPALTTIRQPLQDMGRTAVGLLYRLLEGGPAEAVRIEVATRLILRASTAPPFSR